MIKQLMASAVLCGVLGSSMALGVDVRPLLQAAAAGSQRTDADKARDKYRHPVETLAFFGVTPAMTVVEIWPSSGWYTEILAPYLRGSGHYVAALGGHEEAIKAFQDKFGAKPELYGKFATARLDPPKSLQLVPDGTADAVLTFRNVHNWMKQGQAEAVFASFYKALKKDGILGIEEHRADPSKPQDPQATSGYVREDYVIALAKKAGFTVVAKADINANPKDTKDYAKGVWTLPPVLRLGDQDKDKYQAIGESDRMTLLFKK